MWLAVAIKAQAIRSDQINWNAVLLYDQTASGEYIMAASKPEVHTYQLKYI